MSRTPAAHLHIKRAYDPASASDGTRILVDRLWPRGVKKADAAIDEWAKELAPSPVLRTWFGHVPERFAEFRRRYIGELRAQREALERVRALARKGPVTLVYGARDEVHNGAVVLREVLIRGTGA